MPLKIEKKPNYHGPISMKLPLKIRHEVDRKKSDLARTYEVGLLKNHGTQQVDRWVRDINNKLRF